MLPALPDDFKSGQVTGLKARGGFEIALEWENGKVKQLTIKSTLGGNCRLRLASDVKLNGDAKLNGAKGENTNSFYIADLCIKNTKGNWTDFAVSVFWNPAPDLEKNHKKIGYF